ncbi:calponin homology domain-containing protein [Hordeum vulgare]|nr:calponin homology domain-containing protein [Hordeum vulgare]
MGKSKDKKASREAKVDKKLALGLGVKRKQLKKKKDRVLDAAVESEGAAGHAIVEDKGSKKTVLMKQKKKTKHAKVISSRSKADNLVTLNEDEATPKLKKKNKKQLKESKSPIEVQSPLDSNDAGTMKLKKKKKKAKEGKSSVEPNDADAILHENLDKETLNTDVNQLAAGSEVRDIGKPEKAKKRKKNKTTDVHQVAAESEVMDIGEPEKAKKRKKNKTKKVKQSGEVNKIDTQVSVREDNLEMHEVDTANVDEIASVDEDCSRGMKKWILEYRQKRPGLKVLQQNIDVFITAHEEQQEQEKKEREAAAAEDGWTVVMHHKGRKKTTDAETGTAVGSVSLAAMQEKMAQKKPKEVGRNFYRHQKREAQMSELAMLQSKFEQDKTRIQQLRAQRKFKPYGF